MNGSTVSPPSYRAEPACVHIHTLAPAPHSAGPIFSLPWCHYGNPPSPQLPLHSHSHSRPLLSNPRAVRKRCWSMTERNGLSGWLACKKQNKKPLKNSDKCVMPLVIGAHLGKGVRLCVRVADRAQSIPSEGRNQFHLVLLRRCAGAFVHDWPACTF